MACYIATPRRSYHSGLHPYFGRSAANPFADITSSLQPLFKLFDEELTQGRPSHPLRSFQPRFDVREEEHAYQLQGELPGIDSQDVTIEFKDENTLVIRGRTARASSNKTDSAPAEPEAPATTSDTASESGSTYKQPTVEDEFVDVGGSPAQATPTAEDKGKQVEKTTESAPAQPQHKYWVSERTVGEFQRSFTFPGHVDQEAVTASLKNGILNVTVPKAAQKEPRRITIQ